MPSYRNGSNFVLKKLVFTKIQILRYARSLHRFCQRTPDARIQNIRKLIRRTISSSNIIGTILKEILIFFFKHQPDPATRGSLRPDQRRCIHQRSARELIRITPFHHKRVLIDDSFRCQRTMKEITPDRRHSSSSPTSGWTRPRADTDHKQ